MPNNITRGVRKVNENLLSNGRAIIITEQDKDQYFWDDIPVGSKMINTTDGTEYVKLEGESDWVPSKIKNDGTLSIAKDSIVKVEIFKIVSLDEGNGHFCYTNEDGVKRHQTFSDEGYMFELEKGSYQMYRNHLDVLLDDCLVRNATSGGLTELTPRRFVLKKELIVGEEITARYINTIRLGNPYPRIFESKTEPETQDSEVGDIWVQYDYTLEDADRYQDPDGKIDWTIIKNTPTSLAGYGIKDDLAKGVHTHKVKDIVDFPKKVEESHLADIAKALSGFTLSLTNHLSGSTTINGSNVSLPATIDNTALATAIKTVLSDSTVMNAILSKLPVIRIQSGTITGKTQVPIPNGTSNRANCHFMINSSKGSVTTVRADGTIDTNDTSQTMNYLTIEVQNASVQKYYDK